MILQAVITKINNDIINKITGVGNNKKILVQKIIFIIDKSIYTHNLFYQNSPFYQAFYFKANIIYVYIIFLNRA